MAASRPLVRDSVAFVSAYAPFSSMWTFARDIASGTRCTEDGQIPWRVDQLTRKVFVHSVTAWLEEGEAERLRSAFATEGGRFDGGELSADGQAVYSLLIAPDAKQAEAALHRLPAGMQEQLSAMSPVNFVKDIHAPLMVFLHDRGDQVIPVDELRRLQPALAGRARGALHRDAVPAPGPDQGKAATAASCQGAEQVLSGGVPDVPAGGGVARKNE